MQYAYTAKSTSGAVSTGVLDADSPLHVQKRLLEMGLYALSVHKAESRASSARRNWASSGRINSRDIMAVTSQLAVMTKAGVDLAGAIKLAAEHCGKPALKSTLLEVHRDVESGATISQAMRRHVRHFGEAYVASVAAGEAAGKLPAVLDRLAKLLRSELRLKNSVRTLMAYPMVLSLVSLNVLSGLVFFVLPTFAGIFGDYDVPLPVLTQMLIDLSAELRARWWFYVPAFIASIAGVMMFRRSAVGSSLWDTFLLNMIVVRDATRALLVGRAFQLLGIMLESGVPLLDALRMTRAAMRNILYRKLFDALENDILNGRGLGETMSRARFVPPAAAQMVKTGEQTGSLAMVTRTMGEYYEEEGEVKLRELATILEPTIIIVMGAIVATIVLSVMLPMFDFATLANKS